MTSLARELGAEQDLVDFAASVGERFGEVFGRSPVDVAAGELAERIAGLDALAEPAAALR